METQRNIVPIWKVEDVEVLLGKKKSWIYARVRSGEIPSFKLPGGTIRFSPEDVMAWLEGLKKKSKPATLFALRGE